MSRVVTYAIVALVAFVATVDNTIVAAAAPSIGRELGLSLGTIQWVTLGYLLPFAGLLLVAGDLLDRWGVRRTLLGGLLVFGLGALLGGLATAAVPLVLARVVMGAAAAFLVPGALGLLRTGTDERGRQTGAAIWTVALAVALAAGPVAGGLLSEYLHWSWIFFGNLPFVVAVLVLVPMVRGGQPGPPRRTDLAGMATATAAMVLLIAAVVGFGTGAVAVRVLLGVLGLLALACFVAAERRAVAPLLPRALIGTPVFTGVLAVQLLWGLGISGAFFFTPLMHQDGLGLGPAAAGVPLLVVAGALVAAAPLVPPAVRRFGVRATVSGGLLAVAAGLFAVAAAGDSAELAHRVPGLVLVGAGSAGTVPLTSCALDVVPERQAGIASGLLTASRELAAALGVAVVGAVLALWRADTGADALTAGYSAGLVLAGVLQLAAAVLTRRIFRPGALLSPEQEDRRNAISAA